MTKNEEITTLNSFYESAMHQSNHEGDLIWQKFSAFIVAHSIFFFIIGQIITSEYLINPHQYLFLLSIVGFILSIFWLISTIRGYDTLEYWKSTAIEIANKIFLSLKVNRDKYKIINYYERGYKYFMEYEQVPFDYGYKVDGKEIVKKQRFCLSNYLKFINTRRTAYFSIGLITVIYMIVFYIAISGKQLNREHRYDENIPTRQKGYIFYR